MQLEDYLKLPYPITLRPDEEGDWIAEIEDLEGCVAHGNTQEEALRRLDEAKALWIEEALDHGQPVPKPAETEPLPSGRWVQRTPRRLHKNLARLAKVEGTSLNQLVTAILSDYVGMGTRHTTVGQMTMMPAMSISTVVVSNFWTSGQGRTFIPVSAQANVQANVIELSVKEKVA